VAVQNKIIENYTDSACILGINIRIEDEVLRFKRKTNSIKKYTNHAYPSLTPSENNSS
jgi:hypothetical protein